METAFFIALALLVVGLGGFVVASNRSFPAVVAFVVFGLLVALAWVCLAAPDVALTEAAVGSGATGALLLAACARMRTRGKPEFSARTSVPLPGRLIIIAFCVLVSAGLGWVMLTLPTPAPSLAQDVRTHLPATEVGNPITGVLLAFRAYDTLMEKIVLLVALIGVWSFASDRKWNGRPAFGFPPQPGSPLNFLARVLIPVGVLTGIHLLWTGADYPGGAFQGGVILAAMWILAFFAGVARVPATNSFAVRLSLIVGAAAFIAAGFLGSLTASAFLSYPEGYAKIIIVVVEVAITFSIAATVGFMVAGPSAREPES